MESVASRLDITEFLQEHAANTSKKILDVGCGDAISVTRNLIGPVYADVKYVGLDSPYWDDLGNRPKEAQNRRHFVYGDACNMPFPDATFDLAIATHVFEHVQNFDRMAEELNRVVKPDGRILAVVPLEGRDLSGTIYRRRNFAKDIREVLAKLKIKPYYISSPHVHFMDYSEWSAFFERHFVVHREFARGSFLMLIMTFLHYQMGSLTRQKFNLTAFLQMHFPDVLNRAIRPGTFWKFDGTFHLSPRPVKRDNRR
jgi:SAM-dependent methyltransferase